MYYHARMNGTVIGTVSPMMHPTYWDSNDDRSWVAVNCPSKEIAEDCLAQIQTSIAVNAIIEVLSNARN